MTMNHAHIKHIERLGEAAGNISAELESTLHAGELPGHTNSSHDSLLMWRLSELLGDLADEQNKAGRGDRGRFLAMARTDLQRAQDAILRAHEASME